MSKIANIEKYNRPREKALMYGVDSLTDKELLAIIIRCGTKEKSAIELGEVILKEYKSIYNLLNCDVYDLMKIKGIKKAKAMEIMASIELAKRATRENNLGVLYIKNAHDAYNYMKTELENSKQEQFIVIFLNIKLKIIKKETMFIGGEDCSLIDINLLMKKALTCGARKIICFHNHPSGDIFPSSEDIELTRKIKKICDVVKIELIDHLIIGKNSYFSFKEANIE